MRHHIRGNGLSSIFHTLKDLAVVTWQKSNKDFRAATPEARFSPTLSEPELSAIRMGESWVERISKERSADKGMAFARAVVGIGAILYGAWTILGRDKTQGHTR